MHGARQSAHTIEAPFFVLATQNPIELEGTYPLPEAQLDRFIFNTLLDYLTADDEMKVLDLTTTTHLAKVVPVTNAEEILDFQQVVRMVPIADSVARYAVNLVRATRAYRSFGAGFRRRSTSTSAPAFARRSSWCWPSKARALMHHRYHVTYEDVIALMRPILRHRILLNFQAESDRLTHGRSAAEAAGGDAGARKRKRDVAALSRSESLAASPGSTWWPRPWSTVSSRACTARPISDSARSSPNTAPTRPATICGTSIGTFTRAPRRCF